MKFTLKPTIAGILLMLGLAALVAAGPFEDGADGDYATASRLFRPLAEHGNADAQFNLGIIYQKG